MTLSEFKAWFEGFTEGMDEAPSAKQWKRIQARVKEISGTPISYPVFIDRYRDYQRVWAVAGAARPFYEANLSVSGFDSQTAAIGGQLMNRPLAVASAIPAETSFDSHAAMFAVGRADAEALAA